MAEVQCQAKTGEGEQCSNRAIIPEENPVACHIESHQKQLGVFDAEANAEKVVKELETNKKHIFGTNRLTHTVFVRYPEDDERSHFRAQFTGGRWETDSDEKAKLLMEHAEDVRYLEIEKIQ